MHVPLGKPILGLLSAACIAVPAGIPQAGAAEPAATFAGAPSPHTGTDDAQFDPVPPALRLITEAAAQTRTPGVGASATFAPAEDPLTLALDLATFPYHNVYGVAVSVGSAFADFLMTAALPLSIASLVLVNEEAKIPAYIDTVLTNLRTAIPEIFTAIHNEITYDISLFQQLGGVFNTTTPDPAAEDSTGTPAEDESGTATAGSGALLLNLMTFPYHNVYGVAVSVGSAFADFLMTAALPLSIASLVLVNEEAKIPAYIDTVLTNLRTAIPEIFTAIHNEITYDISLFQQLGGVFNTTTPDPAAEVGAANLAEASSTTAGEPAAAAATQAAADLAGHREPTTEEDSPNTASGNDIADVEPEDHGVAAEELGVDDVVVSTPGNTDAELATPDDAIDAAEWESGPEAGEEVEKTIEEAEEIEETRELIGDLDDSQDGEPDLSAAQLDVTDSAVKDSDTEDSDTADSDLTDSDATDSNVDQSDTNNSEAAKSTANRAAVRDSADRAEARGSTD